MGEQEPPARERFARLVLSGFQQSWSIRNVLEKHSTFLWFHGLRRLSRQFLLEPHVGPLLVLFKQRKALQRLPVCLPTRRRGVSALAHVVPREQGLVFQTDDGCLCTRVHAGVVKLACCRTLVKKK